MPRILPALLRVKAIRIHSFGGVDALIPVDTKIRSGKITRLLPQLPVRFDAGGCAEACSALSSRIGGRIVIDAANVESAISRCNSHVWCGAKVIGIYSEADVILCRISEQTVIEAQRFENEVAELDLVAGGRGKRYTSRMSVDAKWSFVRAWCSTIANLVDTLRACRLS
jgi:hypothetical protein